MFFILIIYNKKCCVIKLEFHLANCIADETIYVLVLLLTIVIRHYLEFVILDPDQKNPTQYNCS